MKIATKILMALTLISNLAFAQETKANLQPTKTPNPELQAALAEFLTTTTNTISETKNFAVEQFPDVIRELILLKRVEMSFYITLWLAIFTLGVVVAYKLIKNFEKMDMDSKPPCVALTIILWVMIILSLFLNFYSWICPWIAPKVFVVEYLSKLIR